MSIEDKLRERLIGWRDALRYGLPKRRLDIVKGIIYELEMILRTKDTPSPPLSSPDLPKAYTGRLEEGRRLERGEAVLIDGGMIGVGYVDDFVPSAGGEYAVRYWVSYISRHKKSGFLSDFKGCGSYSPTRLTPFKNP